MALHEEVPPVKDKLEEPLVRSGSLHDVDTVGIEARDGACSARKRSLLCLRRLRHAGLGAGRRDEGESTQL